MKIAIIGFGVEGKSAVNWFAKNQPAAELTVFDQNRPEGVPEGVGVEEVTSFDAVDFSDYDLVVRSPGIRPDLFNVQPDKLTSGTKLFFEHCPAKIIGVTGTKGKGTTCSFIDSILRAAGHKVWLIGNIGVAALDVLDEVQPTDIVVYEMSNFQLFDMQRSPRVAVVVHLEVDHQDFHTSPDEYFGAKINIARWQKPEDTIIYDGRNQMDIKFADASPSENKIPYPITSDVAGFSRAEIDELLDSVVLPGEHNRWNAEAAILASSQFTTVRDAVRQGLASFTGLPHRLKFVREVNGIRYYDDSISTTVGSAIAAMRSFDRPIIMILGGSSKGVDFTEVAKTLFERNVKHVILIGPEGVTRIKEALLTQPQSVSISELEEYTMDEVIATANQYAEPGDVVVLSPACASFDAFENYSKRGEAFVAAVEQL